MSEAFKNLSKLACRSCGNTGLQPVLSLGETPLANSLLTRDQLIRPEPRYPLDVVFTEAEEGIPAPTTVEAVPAEGIEEAAALLASAERPAIMAGTGLYWGGGEEQLRALAEALFDSEEAFTADWIAKHH